MRGRVSGGPKEAVPRRLLAVIVGFALTVMAPLSHARARHNFSTLQVSELTVAAGGKVEVSGFSYTADVFVQLGDVDGLLLAKLTPSSDNIIKATVTIPADTPPGRHVLFALQRDGQGAPSRLPGRAAIIVTGPGAARGAAVEPQTVSIERPSAFTSSGGTSVLGFAAVAVGTMAGLAVVTLVAVSVFKRRGAGVAGRQP